MTWIKGTEGIWQREREREIIRTRFSHFRSPMFQSLNVLHFALSVSSFALLISPSPPASISDLWWCEVSLYVCSWLTSSGGEILTDRRPDDRKGLGLHVIAWQSLSNPFSLLLFPLFLWCQGERKKWLCLPCEITFASLPLVHHWHDIRESLVLPMTSSITQAWGQRFFSFFFMLF